MLNDMSMDWFFLEVPIKYRSILGCPVIFPTNPLDMGTFTSSSWEGDPEIVGEMEPARIGKNIGDKKDQETRRGKCESMLDN
jgi:hypothetical protein